MQVKLLNWTARCRDFESVLLVDGRKYLLFSIAIKEKSSPGTSTPHQSIVLMFSHLPPANTRHAPPRRSSEPIVSIPTTITTLLREQAFLASLPDSCFKQIQSKLHIHRADPGTIIVQEGSPGNAMYIILKGTASVLSEKSEVELVRLHQGSFFGEIAVFYKVPRTATVRAHTSLTLASIQRQEILSLMHQEPDAFLPLVKEAQTRYYETRPIPSPVSYKVTAQYQLSQLRSVFPAWAPIADDQMIRFINSAELALTARGQIVTFKGEKVALVVRGSLVCQDPISETSEEYTAGQIAVFQHRDASCLAHMTATSEETIAIIARLETLEALQNGKPIRAQPEAEPSTSPYTSRALSSLSITPTSPQKRRRHSADTVFWHNQTVHHPNVLPVETLSVSLDSMHLEGLPTMAALHSILLAHGVQVNDPSRLLPSEGTVDLTDLKCNLTDSIMIQISALLGPTWKSLKLVGVNLSDAAFKAVAEHGKGLVSLHLKDLILVSQPVLEDTLGRCTELSSLSLLNCPGLTDQGISTLWHKPIKNLEISHCRNLGIGCWKSVCGLAPSLESLKLQRVVSLGEEAILFDDVPFPSFPALETLDLSECAFVTSGALRKILSATPSLKVLKLSLCTGLDETLAKALSQMEDAPLHSLDLSYCTRPLTDRSIQSIVTCIPRLETFIAKGARNATGKTLQSLSTLKRLKVVRLDFVGKITQECLSATAHRNNWTIA